MLDPWGDEWFTITTVSQPINDLLSVVGSNIHPPLYYLLLHYWVQLPVFSDLVEKMRAMSAFWMLVATATVYVCWLRHEPRKLQWMFLSLWTLSPSLLLHGRMARSYSMQLAIAPVVVRLALRWIAQPRAKLRFAFCVVSVAILAYTHYLSGLALATTIAFVLLVKRLIPQAVIFSFLVGALYLPWLATLFGALSRWQSASMSTEGHFIVDQIVRLAYLFVSFSFGQTFFSLALIPIALVMPSVIYSLWRGWKVPAPWQLLVFVAIVLAWIGVCRWSQFPFMPTGLFFSFPFFLLALVRYLPSVTWALLLIVYIAGDLAYFQKTGYLIKPYAAPFSEVAEIIKNAAKDRGGVLAIDPYGHFYQPLLARLPNNVEVVVLVDESAAEKVKKTAQKTVNYQKTIWLWRHTRDVSPNAFVTKLERELMQLEGLGSAEKGKAKTVQTFDFVPYSEVERMARRFLRGGEQADYYYQLLKVE